MTAQEIAEFLGADVEGDGSIEISGIASYDSAGDGALAFIDSTDTDETTCASCLICKPGISADNSAIIRSANPKLAFALASDHLLGNASATGVIHPTAVISSSAEIARGVTIGAFCVVGNNARIGEGSVLHPRVSIAPNCFIGRHVILHAGVVIGADGFGYVRDEERYVKFPQVGTVVIEDYVEIGANTCIDRGALGETRIGEGTKIDNLVQIAHNVNVGKRVIIAAQTGISGSCLIEDDVVIGGQVGIGDHVKVLSGAIIGSQAGILPGKIVRPGVWWGTPIQPLDEYKRQNARVKGLDRLVDQVKELQKKIDS